MKYTSGYLAGAALSFLLVGVATSGAIERTCLLEAEEGSEITFPAVVVEKDGSRGGKCVQMGDDAAPTLQSKDSKASVGAVTFNLHIDEAATYYFWIRIQWHCYCSMELALSSTGSVMQEKSDSPQSAALITTLCRPRQWNWLQTHQIAFEKGAAQVRLEQRGHGTLIDTIALSTDAQYTPPDYTPLGEHVAMETVDLSTAERSERDDILLPLSNRSWGDFCLEAVLGISKPSSSGGLIPKVGFMIRPEDGSEARLLSFHWDGGETLVSELIKKEGEDSVVLARNSLILGQEPLHSISFWQEGRRAILNVDGIPALNCVESIFPASKVSFFAENESNPQLREMTLSEVWAIEEYFAEGLGEWRRCGGTWQHLPESASSEGAGLIGHDASMGLLLAPWQPVGTLNLRTKVKLLNKGKAGIGFRVDNPEGLYAVVLALPEPSAGRPCLEMIRSDSGSAQVLRTFTLESDPGQWHELSLQYAPPCVKLGLDGKEMTLLESHEWIGQVSPGLVVLGGGTGLFSSLVASQRVDFLREEYFFEPFCDDRALSHWHRREGKFTLVGHPAVLRIEPVSEKGGNALLEYKRAAPRHFEFSADFISRAELPDSGDELLSAISMPSLPGDSQIGLELRLEGTRPVAYRVSLDKRQMRDVVVTRDGERVAHRMASTPASDGMRRLYLRVEDGRLVTGVSGLVELSVPDVRLNTHEGPRRIFLFAESLEPSTSVSVHCIRVAETPEPL